MHRLFDFKTLQFFSKQNYNKAIHNFASKCVIFKLKQKDSKSSDVCVSCSLPKTDLETHLLSLKNRGF